MFILAETDTGGFPWGIVIGVLVLIVLLVLLAIMGQFIGLYVRATVSGAHVGFMDLLGMGCGRSTRWRSSTRASRPAGPGCG